MSRQSKNQKRGRPLDLQPSYNDQNQNLLITAGYELEIEEIKLDSEYDSDVIVGRGRKAPRVSQTPPHHGPSAMRMLPASPSSPLRQPCTPAQDPALLEWHPALSQQQCPHEVEVQQLRAQVGELQLEAQRNLELRTELHQDYCRMSSEIRELRELLKDLVDKRNWDDLRRQCDEEDRREWENQIATRITFSEAKAIDRVSQLRLELKEELQLRSAKLENLNHNLNLTQRNNLGHEPVVEEPQTKSGLEDSCHSPMNQANQVPPAGPKIWREQMAKRHQRKKKPQGPKKMLRQDDNALKDLEIAIVELKEKIKPKEMARKNTQSRTHRKSEDDGWKVVEKKKKVPKNPETLRINGKYKLVIRSADDGTRVNVQNIRNEIHSESKNRTLMNQLATDNEYAFEYRNRGILGHNHRGGILFTVGTPQEAARCINLGIYLNGRKHRVFVYTRSRADDLCTHCSAWGHLERTCSAERHDHLALDAND
jgi:hypothetical protein